MDHVADRFPLRRLAVVDPIINGGGGNRLLRVLLPSMQELRPDLEITLIGDGEPMRRYGLDTHLADVGVKVRPLKAVRTKSERLFGIRGLSPLVRRLQKELGPRADRLRWLPPVLSGSIVGELESLLDEYDLVWFAWPYSISPPRTRAPRVATIHDLNFKYFFGSPVWVGDSLDQIERQTEQWTRRSTVVASSAFMAAEIARYYPDARPAIVVRLSSFAALGGTDAIRSNEILRGFGLERPYVLCGNHAMTHKNIGPLIAAMTLLRPEFPDLTLVLTGAHTDSATGHATWLGVDRGGSPCDVRGLGYVSNDEMDALIANAAVVVNPSLYEAGNGSGLDAWYHGVPVAMSAIPPFAEHIKALGVWAEQFDPRDPHDIADKIGGILRDPALASKRAKESAQAMARHSWRETAQGYLEVFDGALGQASHAHG